MKYMLLIYNNPATWETMPEAERNALMGDADAIMQELKERGEWVGGEALADASRTKTVRVRDGVTSTTDGPFVESKELLAGYCLIDCETPERAIEVASRWPDSKICATELRPLMDDSGLEM